MRTKNIQSDTVLGSELYDFKVREYYESNMELLIMERLNFKLNLDLEPHMDQNDLKVCFYDFPHRVKLWVPDKLTFSVSQMVERICEQSEEKLPSFREFISSSEYISGELIDIRNRLNKK